MLLGIRHSGYIVSDIDVSRQFYETVLGFEVMQAFEDIASKLVFIKFPSVLAEI